MTADQVQQIINALSKAGGSGWDALIKASIIAGYVQLAWAAFTFALVVTLLVIGVRTKRSMDRQEQNKDDGFPGWASLTVCTVIALVLFAITLWLLASAVTHFADPSCGAIQSLPGLACG